LNRAGDELPVAERPRLAALNARASRAALRQAAPRAALAYSRAGLRLLPPEPWGGDTHALWFSLLRDAAECAGLTGEIATCDAGLDLALARTEAVGERVELCTVGAEIHALSGEPRRALERGREGLALLGMALPLDAPFEEAQVERRAAEHALRHEA